MKYYIKKSIELLINKYIFFILKGKQVYAVTGLRRSGNHAFINWFANSLEGKNVHFEEIRKWHFYKSNTNMTLFFNEINIFGYLRFLKQLKISKNLVKGSSFVIISFEDCAPEFYDKFIPENAVRIAITRSTLNLIASRIQRAVNKARLGQERGDMIINEKFISICEFLCSAEKYGYKVWNFDTWLVDKEYRSNFLNEFSLKYDSNPDISEHGGGSSFSGQAIVPDQDELFSRWKKIDWPRRILELLSNSKSDCILSDQERKFVTNKLEELAVDD